MYVFYVALDGYEIDTLVDAKFLGYKLLWWSATFLR